MALRLDEGNARDMSVFKGSFTGRLYRKFLHKYYRNDLWLDLCLRAKRDTLDYIEQHMLAAQVLEDRLDLLRFALSRAPETGLVLEFGVEKGASIRWLARHTARKVHGFDSFQGLPHDWRGTKEAAGKFDMQGKLPKVPGNVALHVGWFDQTVPGFLAANPGPVALLHVDCDIYESTVTIFQQLTGRLGPGTVIVFDEYYNYPGWRLHEHKAFAEWLAATGQSYRYLGYAAEKGHVAVVLT
jgi:hypothetical protein